MSQDSLTVATPPTRTRSVRVSLFSYGHVNGPIVQQHREARWHKTLAYNIRHLPNPPRHLRAKTTGLSRRLQKEFLQNATVEAFLVKVQEELIDTIRDGCGQLSHTTEEQETEKGNGEYDAHSSSNGDIDDSRETTSECPDIDVAVTICCEEGHHRSVAFVEELVRRMGAFKHGDGSSHQWKLDVNVTHRDIGDVEDLEQSSDQNKRPNRTQVKFRQKERRQKGNRLNSFMGEDDN